MKIGITGASGFLGQAIVDEARSRDWAVVAYSRDPSQSIAGADEVRSLEDYGEIDLGEIDSMIHLAGEPIAGWWSREKVRKIYDSRVDLTKALVEAIEEVPRSRRPKVMVSASAVGFYGNRGDEILDEESDPGFGFLAETCRDWEVASMRAEKLGLRVVNPRLGIVLGDGGFLKRLRPLFRLGLGGRMGNGSQWMSWIHVSDAARLMVEAADPESRIRGKVNCVTPHHLTNREFTQTYAGILGRKAVFPVPAFVLRRLPREMGSLALDSQRADPAVMKAFGFEWKFSQLEEALRNIEGLDEGEADSDS